MKRLKVMQSAPRQKAGVGKYLKKQLNRAIRRQEKQDPETAQKKRRYWGWSL